MKIYHIRRGTESGQSIVIFVLALVVMIGFTALVIDGGYFYWQRQVAQNAADAGALAGAAALCSSASDGSVENAAIGKANEMVTANYATQADVSIGDDPSSDPDPDTIHVTAKVQFQTFFGGVIGVDNLTASASASAICTPAVSAEGPLPITMGCIDDPEPGRNCDLTPIASDICDQDSGRYYIFLNPHEHDLKVNCAEINCSGPDIYIVEPGINGAWVELDPNGTAANAWLDSEFHRFPGSLQMDAIYPDRQDISSSYFQKLQGLDIAGQIIPVPILHQSPVSGHDLRDENGLFNLDPVQPATYRAVSIAAFKVACVYTSGDANPCGGANLIIESGLEGDKFDAVEGCFTRSPFMGPRSDQGVDSGAYSVTLVK